MNLHSLASLAGNELPEDVLNRAREVPLGQTDMSQDTPLHTFVGASVTICLMDQNTTWCALRQVMLPATARGHRQDAMLRADAALEDIVTRLCAMASINTGDACCKRLKAKIFGGADLKSTGLSFSDGAQTCSFVNSWLSTRRISVAAESLGGMRRREIVLSPSKGVVYCRTLPIDEDFLSEERSQLSAAGQAANKIELF